MLFRSHKVKIGLVEVVHSHVTVLSAAAVSSTLGVNGHVVQRTEMAPDTANLLLENLVVEPRLEFTLSCACGGNIHGRLSTAEDNVVLDGCDRGTVEGGIGRICLKNLEAICGDDLGGALAQGRRTVWGTPHLGRLVFGCGDEVGAVCRPLEIGD